MKLVDRTIQIDADVTAVYELLTDAGQFVRWMAPVVTLEAGPGGVVSLEHPNGDVVPGTFVELVPNRRIVFTYGWERADVGVPPGSTIVEIDLRPTNGGIELHRGLPGPMADTHAGRRANYLTRLGGTATGRDPARTCSNRSACPTARSLGL